MDTTQQKDARKVPGARSRSRFVTARARAMARASGKATAPARADQDAGVGHGLCPCRCLCSAADRQRYAKQDRYLSLVLDVDWADRVRCIKQVQMGLKGSQNATMANIVMARDKLASAPDTPDEVKAGLVTLVALLEQIHTAEGAETMNLLQDPRSDDEIRKDHADLQEYYNNTMTDGNSNTTGAPVARKMMEANLAALRELLASRVERKQQLANFRRDYQAQLEGLERSLNNMLERATHFASHQQYIYSSSSSH